MSCEIRLARPEDAKQILEAHYDAVHVLGAKEYPQEILDRWDIGVTPERVRVMERNIKSDDEIYNHAEVDGKVVGFSVVVPKNNELRAVYVHSEFGGKGLGRKLLEAVEHEAKRLDVPYLYLHSSLNAKDFYLNNGYSIMHPGTHHWGNVKMPCEVMRKIFSSNFVDPIATLKTERLLLRPVTLADKEAIFSYAKNPNVSKYTLWEPHEEIEDSEEFIKDNIFPNYGKGVPEPLGICFSNKPNKLIGTVGCFWVSKGSKSMELAYALDEEHWGKGITVEASKALLDFIFANFEVERIQARYKTENVASGRVMEKLGMSYEGLHRKAVFHREKFWDMKIYSVLKEEWNY
ncbi:MAG: GNAT family N-acetyltransferase [Bdellovibrionales bacterium]|nr:GNAT family N-acetyltransferase [Bdellovibrionales bacterium]